MGYNDDGCVTTVPSIIHHHHHNNFVTTESQSNIPSSFGSLSRIPAPNRTAYTNIPHNRSTTVDENFSQVGREGIYL